MLNSFTKKLIELAARGYVAAEEPVTRVIDETTCLYKRVALSGYHTGKAVAETAQDFAGKAKDIWEEEKAKADAVKASKLPK